MLRTSQNEVLGDGYTVDRGQRKVERKTISKRRAVGKVKAYLHALNFAVDRPEEREAIIIQLETMLKQLTGKPRIHPLFRRIDSDVLVVVVRQWKNEEGNSCFTREYHKRETIVDGYEFATKTGGVLYHRTLGKLLPLSDWDNASKTKLRQYRGNPMNLIENRPTPDDSTKQLPTGFEFIENGDDCCNPKIDSQGMFFDIFNTDSGSTFCKHYRIRSTKISDRPVLVERDGPSVSVSDNCHNVTMVSGEKGSNVLADYRNQVIKRTEYAKRQKVREEARQLSQLRDTSQARINRKVALHLIRL